MVDENSTRYYFIKFGYTLLLVFVIGGGYFFREQIIDLFTGEKHETKQKAENGKNSDGKKERKIKYWKGPMDPTFVSDKPGKSPMGMDLVPVYEDEVGDEPGVIRINPVTIQNIGVRTTKAVRQEISKTIRAVALVTYDERRVAYVQAKVSGWVEKLFVDFTGQKVKKGDFLLEIYSPELVSTQEDYILALNYRDSLAKSPIGEVSVGGEGLLRATRRRLELFDVPEHQIVEIEQTREVKKALHIHSPVDGVVVEKTVLEGTHVTPAMRLYTVADLSKMWALADIYEYEIPLVRLGQKASMTLSSIPGKMFHGKVTYVYPYLEKKTRTVQVRMEFDNQNLLLKPDMYANVEIISDSKRTGVTVPFEAVIHAGERNIVVIDKGEGRFAPTEVTLGVEGKDYYEILDGIHEGDTVVTSANFLIDSESNLKEAISKMLSPKKDKQEMKHDMKGMDHSGMEMNGEKMNMNGSGMKHDPETYHMNGADHSKMPGMKQEEMDHSKMSGMKHDMPAETKE